MRSAVQEFNQTTYYNIILLIIPSLASPGNFESAVQLAAGNEWSTMLDEALKFNACLFMWNSWIFYFVCVNRELRCKHYFHKTCIDQWLTKGQRCPMCRSDVVNFNESEHSNVERIPAILFWWRIWFGGHWTSYSCEWVWVSLEWSNWSARKPIAKQYYDSYHKLL